MARLLLRRDLTFAVIVLLFAVQTVIRYGSHVDPAVGWYLYAGGRLLDGAALYSDIFEVNPPLALWMCAAIVALAREIAVDPTLLFKTIFLLLTGASLAASARLLAAATDVTTATRDLLLILIAALMLFLPAAEFGQRDHAAIIVVTPWLLLRWNRLLDRRVPWMLAAAVGVAAAVGMWLKPHFVFVLISIEITMLFAARDARAILRVETLIPIAFGIVYMALIRTSWSATVLTTIALYGSRAYIPIYGAPFESVVARLVLPFALATVAVASTRLLTEHLQQLRPLLFVAGATFVCGYVLQAGLSYQMMPALNFLALAAGLGVVRTLAGEVRCETLGQRLVVGGGAVLILAVFAGALPSQYPRYDGRPFEEAIASEAPDAHTVFIASTEVANSFPLVNETGLVWASRFPSLWLSPYVATKLNDEGGPDDDIARFVLDATVSDLIDFEPDVVFVNQAAERSWYRGAPLDYLAFWDKDSRFRRFWRSYEPRSAVGDFGVYVRSAAPLTGSELPPERSSTDPDVDRPKSLDCIQAEVIGSYC
jgi:hypothetical protein